MTSTPVELIPGSLYALGDAAAASGAISWIPVTEEGYEPINCYLLLDEGGALLVDTGVAAHDATLVAQLEQLLPPGTPLSIFLTRFEGDTITNLETVIRHFRVQHVYGGGVANPFDYFDDITVPTDEVFDEVSSREDVRAKSQNRVDLTRILRGERIPVGRTRRVELIAPQLRVLTTSWIFDEVTGTLFCADAFDYAGLPTADRSALALTDPDEVPSIERMRERGFCKLDCLLDRDANVAPIIADLEEIFSRFDVQNIAPNHGRVALGREATRRYYEGTMAILREGGKTPTVVESH